MSGPANPFRYLNASPQVIRLAVMMYVKYPLSPRNVEDLLFERGIEICRETVRFWWNRFGPMFAAEIKRKRSSQLRQHTQWRWRLDEVYVKINGQMHYLWRAFDHEGEVLEVLATKERDKAAALKLMKRLMKRYGCPETIGTDGLRSYGAAMKEIGNHDRQEVGRWLNNRAENSHQPFRRRERAMERFRKMKTLQKFRRRSRHGSQPLQSGTPRLRVITRRPSRHSRSESGRSHGFNGPFQQHRWIRTFARRGWEAVEGPAPRAFVRVMWPSPSPDRLGCVTG